MRHVHRPAAGPLAVLLLIGGFASGLAQAQADPLASLRWSELTAEERARALRNYCLYDALAAEQKALLLERYQRWSSLSEPDRARLRTQWEELTPEERSRIRAGGSRPEEEEPAPPRPVVPAALPEAPAGFVPAGVTMAE